MKIMERYKDVQLTKQINFAVNGERKAKFKSKYYDS